MFRVDSNRNVRRGFGAALTALVLGTVLVASSGAWPLGQAGAASTTCIWTKHTKRVVGHVKRHGKRQQVVRIKHYWTCRKVAVPGPTPTITTSAPTPTPTPPSEPAPTPTPEPEPNAVSVTANDHTNPYSYVPSRSTVKAGRLTVQLINDGEDEHNMDMQKISPGGVAEGPVVMMVSAEPGKPSEPTSVEVQAGTYRMWCSIGHHAENGMNTTITVE